jgi:hypothetical protein
MSEFLLIAPEGWFKVADISVLPHGAQYFEQYAGHGEVIDVTQMMIDSGVITADQVITAVKYISDTNDVWYSVRSA